MGQFSYYKLGQKHITFRGRFVITYWMDLLQIRAATANQCKFITNNWYRYYKSRQLLQAGA